VSAERKAGLDHLRARLEKLTEDRQQIVNDIDHWNRTHPSEEPLPYELEHLDRLLGALEKKLDGWSAE